MAAAEVGSALPSDATGVPIRGYWLPRRTRDCELTSFAAAGGKDTPRREEWAKRRSPAKQEPKRHVLDGLRALSLSEPRSWVRSLRRGSGGCPLCGGAR